MFGNLVNLHDFVILSRKARSFGIQNVVRKLLGSNRERVVGKWSHTRELPAHWWDIPQVEQRWNRMITGDPSTTPTVYIAQRYLQDKHSLSAVSLGCGTGVRELRWVQACPEMMMIGYDVSSERIRSANATAERERVSDRLRFAVSDVFDVELAEHSQDVVVFEGALHHFSPVERALKQAAAWVKPEGFIIVNEFIGPSRFQYSRRQLEIVEEALSILPENYRKTIYGNIKRRAYRPGRLSMYLSDPSEAAESSKILPLIQQLFHIVERKDYGGTILPLVFRDIAHNFLDGTPETEDWIQKMFEVEDRYLCAGEVFSDYSYLVLGDLILDF